MSLRLVISRIIHWGWFGSHVIRNLGIAARNAALGQEYAEFESVRRRGRVIYGDQSYGRPRVHTFVRGTERLVVGNYSSIGGTFLLGGQHAVDRVTTYPHRLRWKMPDAGSDGFPTPRGDTVVGSDCWVGYESLIMSGVSIGDGAIVAGGAVVTRDVPPYAIVGGNPAKVIRYRFAADQIEALLEIRWWDWSEEEVRAAVPLLAGTDVGAFIEYARARSPQSAASAQSVG